jgi:hypothetical protein
MSTVPEPAVMPGDREAWGRELHLSNFINSYYEYRDLRSLPSCRSVLVIGPGQGLDVQVLRWRGYYVETFDIDETFKPDHLGSAHDLSRFGRADFDVVIASHVLEHLAEPYLDTCLSEIARVGRFALIYLPVAGRHAHLRCQPGVKDLDWSVVFDLFDYFDRPDGVSARYMGNHHFWEVGRRGFGVRSLLRRFERWFTVRRQYRNRDWLPSYNFVLESRSNASDVTAASAR